MTSPPTFLAALPMVCISAVSFLRKPSLSASNIATKETSGRSRPSLNKLIPTIEIDGSTLRVPVHYSPNSSLKLLIYSKNAPLNIKLKESSGSVKWDHYPSTKRLEITLTFSTNNSNEIIIEFPE